MPAELFAFAKLSKSFTFTKLPKFRKRVPNRALLLTYCLALAVWKIKTETCGLAREASVYAVSTESHSVLFQNNRNGRQDQYVNSTMMNTRYNIQWLIEKFESNP